MGGARGRENVAGAGGGGARGRMWWEDVVGGARGRRLDGEDPL